jgi:uncharacterized protein YdaU (DUF1376 family)
MHYYSHHIGDFQRDTASLSDADTLAYLRLIWMYYDTEFPLPNEPEKLAFKIGAASDRVAMILQNYFYLDNNAWRHKRCDEELARVYAASQKARDKANKRWGKAAAMLQQHQEHVDLHNAFGELLDSQSNATVMPQHNHSNAIEPKNDATHIPINPLTQDIKPPKPPKGGSSSISFAEYLRRCKEENKLPIAEDHPVFEYAKNIGLPNEFLKLHWLEFKHRHLEPGSKKYIDWPKAFGNSVRGNWYKLWFADDTGYSLSTTGIQAKKLHKVAA